MKYLNSIETQAVALSDKLPSISSNVKKSIVSAMPVVVIVVAIIQIFTAYSIYDSARGVGIGELQTDLYSSGLLEPSSGFGFFVWLVIVSLLLSAIVLFKSYPDIEAKKKKGWDLVFLSTLINAVHVVTVVLVRESAFGGYPLWTLFGSLVGAYLVLQIRQEYK